VWSEGFSWPAPALETLNLRARWSTCRSRRLGKPSELESLSQYEPATARVDRLGWPTGRNAQHLCRSVGSGSHPTTSCAMRCRTPPSPMRGVLRHGAFSHTSLARDAQQQSGVAGGQTPATTLVAPPGRVHDLVKKGGKSEHSRPRLVSRPEQHHLDAWRPGLLPAPRTMTEREGGGYPDSKGAAPYLDIGLWMRRASWHHDDPYDSLVIER